MNPTFTKAYEASAAIPGRRIVAFSAPTTGAQIAAATTPLVPTLGISDGMGAEAGGMCDVHRAGIAPVELGGTVAAGAPLMADAQGRAIDASAADADATRVVGFADAPGVLGDIIPCWLAPGLLDRA